MNKKKIILIIAAVFLIALFSTSFILYKNIIINNIEITDIDEHKVNLKWNGNNREYKLMYSINENMEDSKEIIVSNNNVEINELLSNTDYYFYLESILKIFNKDVYTYKSNVIKHHTKDIILDKVENVSIKDITDKNGVLTWDLISKDVYDSKGNKIEINYDVYLQDNEEYKLLDTVNKNEYKVNDLQEFTKYKLKVLASIVIDEVKKESEEFDEIDFTTLISSVKNVKASGTSTSEIKITWDKSKLENATYNIYGSDSKDKDFKLLKENITENNYVEKGLKENKTRYYYVEVVVLDNKSISSVINGTTKKKAVVNTNTSTSSSGSSNSDKDAQAIKVAKEIASSVTGNRDIDKICNAAKVVASYAHKGTYTMEGKDYRTAYGVFVKGEYSCAGTARALGLVLDYMGFKWKHINANQYTHQWVEVYNVDGQTAWADGQIGLCGYGKR